MNLFSGVFHLVVNIVEFSQTKVSYSTVRNGEKL